MKEFQASETCPHSPPRADWPDVNKYIPSTYNEIRLQGQTIFQEMQDLITLCDDNEIKFACGILSDTVKKSKNLMDLYLTWESRTDTKTGKTSYSNRNTGENSDYPLPKGYTKEGNRWKNNKGVYFTKPPSHFTTSSEVEFLLRMAEVIDAQDVLHSMRLLLYA